MSRQRKDNTQYRNIRLTIETYEKLDKYKIKLIGEKGDSRVTFDDAINILLDKEV